MDNDDLLALTLDTVVGVLVANERSLVLYVVGTKAEGDAVDVDDDDNVGVRSPANAFVVLMDVDAARRKPRTPTLLNFILFF